MIEISAPFGLDDLAGGVLRPTPRFAEAEQDAFLDRVERFRKEAAYGGMEALRFRVELSAEPSRS